MKKMSHYYFADNDIDKVPADVHAMMMMCMLSNEQCGVRRNYRSADARAHMLVRTPSRTAC